jgi:amino acid adenylation domain-containing protein
METSAEVVVALWAVLKAGAAFTVINPTTKAEKLAAMVGDERPAALLTRNDTLRARAVANALPMAHVPLVVWVGGIPEEIDAASSRFMDWDALMSAGSTNHPHVGTVELDLATIIYTSGSTGVPKGVMSTHRNMVFAATSISTYLENTQDDIIFCALPLAFDYGLYQVIMAARVGATVVLEKNFVYPYKAIEIMIRERVTGFPGVPTMFSLILNMKNLSNYDLSCLRYISNTAAALPVSHIRDLRAAFPDVTLFSMYGLTECKRVSYLPPSELDRRPESIGLPIPGTEVYVVDDDGGHVPPGTVGELVVRGPHVMRGYWEKPEETAQRYRPGPVTGETVLYTGDLVRQDAEGFLYFVARKDDIIKTRGEKVSPKEIENCLYAMPGVYEAAAIGVPDETLGEAIKVFVVPRPGIALVEREIRRHCAQHLEDFMMPKYIEIRSELPKGDTGKIDTKELKACAA